MQADPEQASCELGWLALCMYVKIRRHQHTRVHAHTGPRRHTRAPACHRHRHHIPLDRTRTRERVVARSTPPAESQQTPPPHTHTPRLLGDQRTPDTNLNAHYPATPRRLLSARVGAAPIPTLRRQRGFMDNQTPRQHTHTLRSYSETTLAAHHPDTPCLSRRSSVGGVWTPEHHTTACTHHTGYLSRRHLSESAQLRVQLGYLSPSRLVHSARIGVAIGLHCLQPSQLRQDR